MSANLDYQLDLSGLDDLIQSGPERLDAFGRTESERIVSAIKLSFNTSPPGRTYTRGSISHTASQPGFPPNVDIGSLRASMRWETVAPLTYHVMDGVEHGLWLEEGTSTMDPRPFVQPVFKQFQSRIEQDARDFGVYPQ